MVQQVTAGTLDMWKFPKVYLIISLEPRYQPISPLPANQSVTLPTIIGGTCMWLSVILLVNKCNNWLVWKSKDNRHCKNLLYFIRETTMSWMLLFIILNRNNLIIKLFVAMNLVGIYVEYTCIMNMHVSKVCVYVF